MCCYYFHAWASSGLWQNNPYASYSFHNINIYRDYSKNQVTFPFPRWSTQEATQKIK
jgi:hypothetical protein